MPSTLILLTFIPTFFLVSISPGMCMTLAMTLGMSIGVRKTLWMMIGELLGVAIVAVAAVLGVASIMNHYPLAFDLMKIIGACYLVYCAIQLFKTRSVNISLSTNNTLSTLTRKNLFNQGFFTAIANPKGWAFMISLLPPFISKEVALAPQLLILLFIIMCSEFICMMIYASGGKALGKILIKGNKAHYLNILSGGLLLIVAVWLLAS